MQDNDDIGSEIRLSVIIPVRNGQKYIKRAITSTLRFLGKDSEIVVINDGSTDRTQSILESIKDSRLILFRLDVSKGIANALNFGLKQSRGNYIARMDGDDICLPWRFSSQLRKFNQDKNLDFLFSTAIAFGKELRPYPFVPQLPIPLTDVVFRSALLEWNPAVHPTMMARKKTLLDLGGYRDVVMEDLDLWLRAALAGKTFARAAIPTILLRLHADQTTRQPPWRSVASKGGEVVNLRKLLREQNINVKKYPFAWLIKTLFAIEKQGLPKMLAPWKKSE